MKIWSCCAFLACALALAVRAEPTPSVVGAWAGDRARLALDERGGRLQMDCASGSFPGPLHLADDGAFRVLGTFEHHGAGPQRADADAAAPPAQFVGQVKDGIMTLSILAEGQDGPQVLHLRRGATVKLLRCL
jgi:hypothetical protein